MAKHIVMEEFHVTVSGPDGLPEHEYDAMRQTLDDPQFHAALRRAARAVVRRHPPLAKVTVKVTR